MLILNRTIKLLIISDVFVVTGFGLIDPILAIFIKDNLIGGTVFTAGFASTLFLLTRSIIQVPFSLKIDKMENKAFWLIIGTLMVAGVPFIYIFSQHIQWIYLAQIIHGIGSGLAFPAWLGIWSLSLDKGRESFEWSLYSTLVSLGAAITASIGGAIAEFVGFKITFLLVGVMALIGGLVLLLLLMENDKEKRIRPWKYFDFIRNHFPKDQ